MKIRMLRDRRRAVAGQVIEMPRGTANVLIRRGFAEEFVEVVVEEYPALTKKIKAKRPERLVVNA